MPLTISHPAASVPFAKSGLVFSALVIGSITPDLPYFIPFSPQSNYSHSIIGLFVFCLPLGLTILFIFHFLFKYPVLSLLPTEHQKRLYGVASIFSFKPLKRFLNIVFSILVGALTHIIWDSFTHPKGWIVQQFPILKLQVLAIGSYSVPIYELLQHSSTFLGGVLLCYWYVKWYKRAKLSSLPINLVLNNVTKLVVPTFLGISALVIAILSGFETLPISQTPVHYRLFVGHVFIVGISVFVSELMLFSSYWHLILKKKVTENS